MNGIHVSIHVNIALFIRFRIDFLEIVLRRF